MPDPAQRVVTFLFTDIEGSTRLWEEHPDAMREALARHDDLLRGCIEGHGGRVFKTAGDAFWAVFPTAVSAVETGIAVQSRLPTVVVRTPEGERPVRVRMALHSAVAEERDGDFFGPPVNRTARLLAVGHGGQVLLSGAAQERVRDHLPAAAALLDLGEHRLKDLGEPERVFQLLHPELTRDFPPLRSLDNPELKHNLPLPATRFIGRERELANVKALLRSSRLLTLTGPGGTGKTRLALQAAADRLDENPDGVWVVELAGLSDPALVPAAVAAALRLREAPGRPVLETLTDHLREKRLLLVLDNCEHLLEACAQLSDLVLRQCPHVRILATSREALGIYGETAYQVPTLTLPDARRLTDPERLAEFESVRLFVDRAVQVQPDFQVTGANAASLVSICCRLDGIPLALELAAARMRSLTLEEIDQRLDHRFQLLTGGSAASLPRQQTLRSLIDWSYDLLNPQEKALLERLSVFAGGWTLPAAEAVCAGEPLEDWEMLDLLISLSDKSLVTVNTSSETTRYRLLETVRQYAAERLQETTEEERWRRRHLEYFTELMREGEPHLSGAAQKSWLERLDLERDNLRSALEWAAEEVPEAGLRLAGFTWRFWDLRAHFAEGRKLLTLLLLRSPGRTEERARALRGAGLLAFRQGDPTASRGYQQEGLEISTEVGDRAGIAASLNSLGNVAWIQGDYPAARELHERSLQLRQELGDRRGVAASLNNLGNLAMRQGDLAAARRYQEDSLAITREFGDLAGIGISLNNLGNIVRLAGDLAAARALHEESLKIRRDLGDRVGMASSLNNLAMTVADLGDFTTALALHRESLQLKTELGDREGMGQSLGNQAELAYDLGDITQARDLYERSLRIFQEMGDPWGIAGVLEGMAGVAGSQGGGLKAARLLGAAARLREEIGSAIPAAEQHRHDRQVADARAAAGTAYETAWEEGRTFSQEEAIRLALQP